ncbi:MAG: cytochrome b [Pseudomonadota bacterium]|nr:cytochrome b [Pseudomonadota bacterium]
MPIRRYTRVAVVLHWLVAALIVINVLLAWTWHSLSKPNAHSVVNVHKSIGLTVLGLALLRLLWRIGHRPPDLPAAYQRWESVLSHIVHGFLYLIMFGLPITGYIMDSASKASGQPIMWFGLIPIPHLGAIMQLAPGEKQHVRHLFAAAHSLSAVALYVLLFLHIAGALKHQFIDREKEIQRMSWGSRG